MAVILDIQTQVDKGSLDNSSDTIKKHFKGVSKLSINAALNPGINKQTAELDSSIKGIGGSWALWMTGINQGLDLFGKFASAAQNLVGAISTPLSMISEQIEKLKDPIILKLNLDAADKTWENSIADTEKLMAGVLSTTQIKDYIDNAQSFSISRFAAMETLKAVFVARYKEGGALSGTDIADLAIKIQEELAKPKRVLSNTMLDSFEGLNKYSSRDDIFKSIALYSEQYEAVRDKISKINKSDKLGYDQQLFAVEKMDASWASIYTSLNNSFLELDRSLKLSYSFAKVVGTVSDTIKGIKWDKVIPNTDTIKFAADNLSKILSKVDINAVIENTIKAFGPIVSAIGSLLVSMEKLITSKEFAKTLEDTTINILKTTEAFVISIPLIAKQLDNLFRVSFLGTLIDSASAIKKLFLDIQALIPLASGQIQEEKDNIIAKQREDGAGFTGKPIAESTGIVEAWNKLSEELKKGYPTLGKGISVLTKGIKDVTKESSDKTIDKLDEVKQAIESSFSFGSLYSLINQFISKQSALQTANANAAREAEIEKNKALLGNVANPHIAEIGRITKSIASTSLKIAEIEKQQTAIPAQIAQLEKERTDYLDQVEDFQKQLVLAGVSGFTKTDIDQKKALLKYQISNLPSGDLQARGKLQTRLETISQIQVNLENATADAQAKQDAIDKLKETSYLDQLAKESKLLDSQKKSLAESEKKKREFSAAQTASQKQAQAEIDRLNAEANTASFSFKDMLLKVVSNWNGLWSDGLDGMKGLNSKLKEFADNSIETQNLVYKIGSQFLKNNTLLDLFYNIPLEAYKQASRDLDSLHQETEAQQEQYIASKAVLTEMMEAVAASNNTTLLTSLKAQSAFLDDVNNQIQGDLLKQIDNFKELLVFGLTKLFNDTLSGIQDSLNEVYSSMIRSPFAREMFDLGNTISNLTKEFALFSDEMFLLQKRTEYAKQGLSEVDINTLIEKEKELAKLKIEAAKAEKEAAETNYKRNAEREFGFDKASFPAWDESKFKRKDINSFEIAQKMDSLDPNMYLGDTDVTIEAFRSKFAEIKDGIKEISKDFTDYLSQGAEALFGDFFERIGSVMGGGKFNAKELLKGFVDFLGQMLVSLGSTMLALGTQLALMAPAFTALGVLGLPQFAAAGATAPLLIAGGLGLIAAGSMVKGFSNAALGSKSGGGSSASTSPSSNPSATRDNIIGQGRSNISPANLTVIVNAPSLSTSADIAMQVRDAMQYSYVVR